MKQNHYRLPLLFSVIFFLLFALLLTLLLTTDRAPVGQFDRPVGLSDYNGDFQEAVGKSGLAYTVSEITGILLLLALPGFAFFGIYQWFKRKKLSLVDRDLFCLAGLYVITLGCYGFFEFVIINYRPVFEAVTEYEASFPSSHTLLAVTFGLSGASQLGSRIKSDKLRATAVTALCLLTLITVLGRALSGVHWLTDIYGAILLGGGLVCLYQTAVCLTKKESNRLGGTDL